MWTSVCNSNLMQLVSGGRSQCGFDPLRGGDMYMCTAQIDKTLTLRHTNWRAGQCQVAHGMQKVPTFGLEDGTHSKLPDLVVSAVAQLQVRLVVEPAQHCPVTVTAIMALASIMNDSLMGLHAGSLSAVYNPPSGTWLSPVQNSYCLYKYCISNKNIVNSLQWCQPMALRRGSSL